MIRPLTVATNYADLHDRSGRALTFLKICRSLMLADVRYGGAAVAAARLDYPDAERILRAAVAGTQLSELPDYIAISTAWTGQIRNSAFDFLSRYMKQVPRRSRTGLMTAVGSTEVEGAAKSLSKLTLEFGSLTELKCVAFVIASRETVQADDFSLTVLGDELRGAVRAATDPSFVTALESGATSVTATGVFEEDMRALLALVTRGADSRPVFIGGKGVRDQASLQAEVQRTDTRLPIVGGEATLLGLPYVTSDALADGELLLVDASRIAYWDDGIAVSMAEHASLQMDSDPTQSSISPPAATTVVNLWQTDNVGFRAERRFAVKKLTTTCVGKLAGLGEQSPVVNW
jgi:hypothetical protein